MPIRAHIYTKKIEGETFIISVYVDDLLITRTSKAVIEKFKTRMNERIETSDLDFLSRHLGIEVSQSTGHINLKQTGYAKKILEK